MNLEGKKPKKKKKKTFTNALLYYAYLAGDKCEKNIREQKKEVILITFKFV
jgi:hypothetical protein